MTLNVDPAVRLSYQLFCGQVEPPQVHAYGVPSLVVREAPLPRGIDVTQTRRPKNCLAQDSARGR